MSHRFLGLVLALGLGAAQGRTAAAAAVELRAQPVSHGPVVTLGDVFEGVEGSAAGVVLARAAPLGLDAILDAGAVQLAARRVGLDWANAQGFHRIAVASEAGVEPAADEPKPLRARSGAGRGRRGASALVYARNIAAGEILRAEDLIWSEEAVAPSDAVTDPDAAIGKAARHALRSGAPTGARDLASPVVVRRDDVIAVTFETDGISLTLQAKAQGDASVGQTVEVMNTQSKKVIEAVCSGPDQAVVGPRAEALKASAYQTEPQARLQTALLH
jgi:flagella basal body P-ring formation protein FlgA